MTGHTIIINQLLLVTNCTTYNSSVRAVHVQYELQSIYFVLEWTDLPTSLIFQKTGLYSTLIQWE